ncbi:MAG: twin-arginine translocase TatA/TatE family subunit [Gemmatimonadaceae bacterium]|nr:twin-arginine translocase TatA/TatE family subunit [Gemmatimonadaceae bacterium]
MEILLILVAVLLLFGAKRLPEIGASFGKSIKAFKRGLNEANDAITEDRPADRLNSPMPQSSAKEEEPAEPRRLMG